jgi:hypothetical protein
MATALRVAGPSVVRVDNAGAGTYSVLGYSDNDNLPSVQVTDYNHEIKTVLSGNTPEEIVLTGMTARISVALVKWDEDVLDAMLDRQRGTYNVQTIGRRVIANNAFLGVEIASVSQTMKYRFTRCILPPDGMGDSQWGNRERVLTLQFYAFPDPTTSTLYSYTE